MVVLGGIRGRTACLDKYFHPCGQEGEIPGLLLQLPTLETPVVLTQQSLSGQEGAGGQVSFELLVNESNLSGRTHSGNSQRFVEREINYFTAERSVIVMPKAWLLLQPPQQWISIWGLVQQEVSKCLTQPEPAEAESPKHDQWPSTYPQCVHRWPSIEKCVVTQSCCCRVVWMVLQAGLRAALL